MVRTLGTSLTMFPTSILLSSTRTPSPKLCCLSLTSTYIYLATIFKRLFTTKKQTHSYLHHQSSHPRHSKNSLPYSQLLRLRRLCSDDHDFTTGAQEMCGFFQERGYPSDLLREDLRKISRSTGTTPSIVTERRVGYHWYLPTTPQRKNQENPT